MQDIRNTFDLSELSNAELVPIEKAFALVAQVHQVPDRPNRTPPKITRPAALPVYNGFVFDSGHVGYAGATMSVFIGMNSPHPLYDAVHELGHVLDRHYIAYLLNLGNISSLEAPQLEPLFRAIKESAAYTELKERHESLRKYKYASDIGELSDSIKQGYNAFQLVDDALKPSEFFARAYVQAVLILTADKDLDADFARYRDARSEVSTSFVWESNDFAPILEQMELIFKNYPPNSAIAVP